MTIRPFTSVLPVALLFGLLLFGVSGCAGVRGSFGKASDARKNSLRGTYGTYAGEPRLANGRMDLEGLVADLAEIRAHTYNFLIWHAATDWEDLQEFLPLARQKNIKVWVTLVPPSESPPHTKAYSEPFRLDYERWAVEIARLSRKHPNLVAWSLDDFSHNGKILTPERLEGILTGAREINPKLAFVPCIYYRHATPEFASTYAPLIDGILFPFRNESVKMNLSNFETVDAEVRRVRELFGGNVPVFVDVYATKHSRLNDSTPDYVREVMLRGRRSADGVLIYCHQSKATSPAKYEVIRTVFKEWAGDVR
jgi:hypothetical protein